MSRYKYILLDADNTLYDFDLAEHDALHATMAEFGVSLSEEEHSVYHGINDNLWKMLERGETTREELKTRRFDEFAEYLGMKDRLNAEELAKGYVVNLAKQCQLIDGAEALCRELSKKYRLSLITNGLTNTQRSRISLSPLPKYFTDIFISEEMGCAKPSVEFFDCVRKTIGDDDLSAYLVIGDSLSSDIQGAVNFGCDSVWISRDGKSDPRPTYTVTELSEIYGII